MMGRACMKTTYYFRDGRVPDNYAEVASKALGQPAQMFFKSQARF